MRTAIPACRGHVFEDAFREFLGIERTIWLEHGLLEDRTDGHLDDPLDPDPFERSLAQPAPAGFVVLD